MCALSKSGMTCLLRMRPLRSLGFRDRGAQSLFFLIMVGAASRNSENAPNIPCILAVASEASINKETWKLTAGLLSSGVAVRPTKPAELIRRRVAAAKYRLRVRPT